MASTPPNTDNPTLIIEMQVVKYNETDKLVFGKPKFKMTGSQSGNNGQDNQDIQNINARTINDKFLMAKLENAKDTVQGINAIKSASIEPIPEDFKTKLNEIKQFQIQIENQKVNGTDATGAKLEGASKIYKVEKATKENAPELVNGLNNKDGGQYKAGDYFISNEAGSIKLVESVTTSEPSSLNTELDKLIYGLARSIIINRINNRQGIK